MFRFFSILHYYITQSFQKNINLVKWRFSISAIIVFSIINHLRKIWFIGLNSKWFINLTFVFTLKHKVTKFTTINDYVGYKLYSDKTNYNIYLLYVWHMY